MTSDGPLLLESGDLSICPERGEVRNARGEATRLGPVNMKVLALLLDRAGQVVSRNELYEAVWKNQLVGDDALTRAISDIRAEIGRLSESGRLIETLPKRGYRWTADVRKAVAGSAAAESNSASARPAAADPARSADDALEPALRRTTGPAAKRTPAFEPPRRPLAHSLLVWSGRGAAYVAVFLLLASLGVWLTSVLTRPGPQIVAVLPTAAEPARRELAAGIEQQLVDHLIGLDRVSLLSRSAVESRPSNPFPYFYYEFGASWLVESELRALPHRTALTVRLVDARTGIVLLQSAATIDAETAPSERDVRELLAPVEAYLSAQADR